VGCDELVDVAAGVDGDEGVSPGRRILADLDYA
jgi:hypothetical protein